MHNLSETGVFGAAVSVPDDGIDDRTAASLYAALQELTNRTRALYEFLAEFTGTLALPANLSITGSTNSHGALTASTTFHCIGAATFDTAATFNAGATCTSLVLSETLNTANLSSTGTSALHICTADTLTAAACNATQLNVATYSIFQGSCTFHDVGYIQDTFTCTGAGRIIRQAALGVASGACVLNPTVATSWLFGSAANAMTGDINATLAGVDGDEIEVTLQGAAGHVLNVLYPGGGTLFTLTGSFAAGTYNYVRVKRIAGTWYYLNYATHP